MNFSECAANGLSTMVRASLVYKYNLLCSFSNSIKRVLTPKFVQFFQHGSAVLWYQVFVQYLKLGGWGSLFVSKGSLFVFARLKVCNSLANVCRVCGRAFQTRYLLIPSTDLKKKLEGDHIEDITKAVTPKALTKYKSNTLLKGIEVLAQDKFTFVL